MVKNVKNPTLDSVVRRLSNGREHFPTQHPYLQAFGRYFSNFLPLHWKDKKTVTSFGFVSASEIAIEDIRQGKNRYTYEPVPPTLHNHADELYSLWYENAAYIAAAVGGEDFGARVKLFYKAR